MAYDRRRLVYTVLILWSPPVLCNLGTGDSRSDDPSMWQYIVIALAMAFFFMTGESTFSFCKAGCTRSPADYHRLYYVVVLVCLQVARLRRRSESLENGVRPIIHITRSGARVYAPLPILNQEDLDHLDTVEYNGQDIQEQSCSICLDTFHSHTKVRLLPCHHAFHPVCIGKVTHRIRLPNAPLFSHTDISFCSPWQTLG